MPSYDITLPVHNDMWCYRSGWDNNITTLSDTNHGAADTVYRFDLCSHTGTYIETAGHKLRSQLSLSDLPPSAFCRQRTAVIRVQPDSRGCVTLRAFLAALSADFETPALPNNLIVVSGWGSRHSRTEYLPEAPWFEAELTAHLAALNLHILGFDTPIIDDQQQPYDAVKRLFKTNPKCLLLAPLTLPEQVDSGIYELDCLPLNIIGVSAAPCRAILVQTESDAAATVQQHEYEIEN